MPPTPPTPTFSSGLNKHQNDAPKGKDDTRDSRGPSLGRATMPSRREWCPYVSRVNSTNVLDEGLRIGGIGHQMNSKIKSVKQGVYQE
jgi:hypothetical protein